MPAQRNRIPALPSFWGPFYLCITLCCRTTKFDVVTDIGEGRVSWGQLLPGPKRAEFRCSPVFGVLLYSCLCPMQNDQIQHGNTYGEGRVFSHAIAFAQMHLTEFLLW